MLGLLGVRSLVQQPGDRPLRSRHLVPAYRGRDATIHRNRFALPRAFLVERQRVVAGEDEALRAVTAPGTDLAHAAVVEKPVSGMGGARSLTAAPPVRITRYDPEHVELATTARRRSILVLSDVWYPGLGGEGRRARGADRARRLPPARRGARPGPAQGRDALPAAELPPRLDHQPADGSRADHRGRLFTQEAASVVRAWVRRHQHVSAALLFAAHGDRLRRPRPAAGQDAVELRLVLVQGARGARRSPPTSPGRRTRSTTTHPPSCSRSCASRRRSCPTCRCGTRTS